MENITWEYGVKGYFDSNEKELCEEIDELVENIYSDDQMAVFTYTEGDIYLTPFTDREKYEKEKADTIKFYEEVY